MHRIAQKKKHPILWLVAPPNSGKTAVARGIAEILLVANLTPVLIDGTELRKWMNRTAGFDKESRLTVCKKTADYVAKVYGFGHHIIPIVSLITPYQESREYLRKRFGKELKIIYLQCSDMTRMQRNGDKGLTPEQLNADYFDRPRKALVVDAEKPLRQVVADIVTRIWENQK